MHQLTDTEYNFIYLALAYVVVRTIIVRAVIYFTKERK